MSSKTKNIMKKSSLTSLLWCLFTLPFIKCTTSSSVYYQTINEADSLKMLAIEYKQKQDYVKALDFNYQALEKLDNINEDSLRSRIFFNIGVLKEAQFMYKSAIDFFDKALEIAFYTKDTVVIGYALYHKAFCLNSLGYADSSYHYYRQLSLMNLPFIQKNVLMHMGYYFLEQTDNFHEDSAYFYLSLSQKIRSFSDNFIDSVFISYYWGLFYQKKYQISSDKVFLDSAYHYFNFDESVLDSIQSMNGDMFLRVFMQKANIAFEKNDYQSSSINYRRAIALIDNEYNSKNTQAFNELIVRYDLLEKEKRIVESELKSKIYVIISVVFFVFLIFILIFSSLVIKKNRTISQQINEINMLYQDTLLQKKQIEQQRDLIHNQKSQIDDSIQAAVLVQKRLMERTDLILAEVCDNISVLFLPKDSLSGDFYWSYKTEDYSFIGVFDCTGHGVRASLIATIAYQCLNEILGTGCFDPAEILKQLDDKILTLYLSGEQKEKLLSGNYEIDVDEISIVGALLRFDKKTSNIVYCSAKGLFYLLTEDHPGQITLTVQEYDSSPLGVSILKDFQKPYQNYSFSYKKNSVLHLFSDGFQDQFNEEREKYKTKRLKQIFINVFAYSPLQQKELLLQEFEKWKGKTPQTDDVLIVTIKF